MRAPASGIPPSHPSFGHWFVSHTHTCRSPMGYVCSQLKVFRCTFWPAGIRQGLHRAETSLPSPSLDLPVRLGLLVCRSSLLLCPVSLQLLSPLSQTGTDWLIPGLTRRSAPSCLPLQGSKQLDHGEMVDQPGVVMIVARLPRRESIAATFSHAPSGRRQI